MIKKIKLYFINRKIKKIQKEIDELRKQLNWVYLHLHELSTYESFDYINAINIALKIRKQRLNELYKTKEMLLK